MTERTGKPPDGFCRMHTRDMQYCWRPGAVHLRLGCQHEHLTEGDLCERCIAFVETGEMRCGDCATAAPELIQPWMDVIPGMWLRPDRDGNCRREVSHDTCSLAVIPEPAEPAEPLDNVQISA
jgi:hypothetical protein